MKKIFSLSALPLLSMTLSFDALSQSDTSSQSVELPTIEVEAEGETTEDSYKRYSTPNATTATKTNTPIFDTPASVSAVPKSVLRDQKTTRIKDALENVSSVRPNGTLGSGNDYIIRGFSNDREIFRNSLNASGGRTPFPTRFDTYNVERLEVLKGPSSVLFGRAEPGGLINVVTKRPQEDPYYAIEPSFGSFNQTRVSADATGPVLGNESFLFRLTGVYEDKDTFRDFGESETKAINPSLTWKIGPATEWTAEVEHIDYNVISDFGLPAIGRDVADVPIDRSFGDPNDPVDDLNRTHVGSDFTHRFNGTWTLRSRFLATFAGTDRDFVNPAPAFGDAIQDDGRTLSRNIFGEGADTDAYSTNLELLGDFKWGVSRHQTLIGFDYLRSDVDFLTFGRFNEPNPELAIDIFNPEPSYGIDPSLFRQARSVTDEAFGAVFEDRNYGVYFQDHITLWEQLHILAGGRYDWARTRAGFGGSLSEARDGLPDDFEEDEEFSPRAGILYQPLDWLGVYGSYTSSFAGNNGVSATGESFDPERGEQFEVGLKTELYAGRFAANLALFDLTRENLLTPDLDTPDPNDSIAVGEQTTQGLEIALLGEVLDGLSVIASYTHFFEREVSQDNTGLEGNTLANVPSNAGNVSLQYDIKQTALRGLSVGIGAFFVGERQGDIDNTFDLPGYGRLDGSLGYSWRVGSSRVTAEVNFRNILDKEYFESADPSGNVAPRLGIYPGEPFSAVGSVRVEF